LTEAPRSRNRSPGVILGAWRPSANAGLENHAAAVSLNFVHDNVGRILKTLRATSAMETAVTDHVWSLEERWRRAYH
jgi:hypothetical protein